MAVRPFTTALLMTVLTFTAIGCSHTYYAPSPPPPVALQMPPIVALGDRNGFLTGRSEGARDAYNGFPFNARRTRAFHDTPGYDGQLGPFGMYRHAFRDAYLRGYDAGFRRQ